MGRRVVPVSHELLAQWWTQGQETHIKCVGGLPADAKFIGMGIYDHGNVVGLTFESLHWPEIVGPLPYFPIVFETLK